MLRSDWLIHKIPDATNCNKAMGKRHKLTVVLNKVNDSIKWNCLSGFYKKLILIFNEKKPTSLTTDCLR
jgi:hypothetical protein